MTLVHVRRALLLALVVGFVLSAAACGGDEGAVEEPAEPAAPEAAETEAGEEEAAAEEPSGEPLKFGLITDISKFSDFGLRTKDGVELAVDEVNEAGGVNGHPVEIVFGDSAGDPQEAAILVRKMAADDEVLAVWGPFTSGEAEVAFPQANQLEVPIIASTSGKPGVSGQNRPWAFRNTATEDKVLDPAMAKFVEEYGPERVAIAADVKEPVAKTTGTILMPMLAEKHGLEVINPDDPVTWETGAQDFSAQVTRLKSMEPDAVLLGTTPTDAARLAKEMQRQGLDVPGIGGVSMFGTTLLTEGGEAVEGWFTAGVFWKQNPDPEVQEFVENIRERHASHFPDDPDPIPDSAAWYDTAKITMQIVAENGITPDTPLDEARTTIRDGWANLTDYEGVTGLTSINEEGDGVKEVYVMMVKDADFERVE